MQIAASAPSTGPILLQCIAIPVHQFLLHFHHYPRKKLCKCKCNSNFVLQKMQNCYTRHAGHASEAIFVRVFKY